MSLFSIFSFIRGNWSAIILATLFGIIGYQFYSITDERDDALRELSELQHAINIAKAENVGKLAALKAEGIRNKAAQDKQHIADIQHIGKLYGSELNDTKAAISIYRNSIADSVRKLQALSDRLRESENDADRLAGNDSNTAAIRIGEESPEFYKSAYLGAQQFIETLKQAGAVCAADYNACKSYVDSEQERIGVYAE